MVSCFPCCKQFHTLQWKVTSSYIYMQLILLAHLRQSAVLSRITTNLQKIRHDIRCDINLSEKLNIKTQCGNSTLQVSRKRPCASARKLLSVKRCTQLLLPCYYYASAHCREWCVSSSSLCGGRDQYVPVKALHHTAVHSNTSDT